MYYIWSKIWRNLWCALRFTITIQHNMWYIIWRDAICGIINDVKYDLICVVYDVLYDVICDVICDVI